MMLRRAWIALAIGTTLLLSAAMALQSPPPPAPVAAPAPKPQRPLFAPSLSGTQPDGEIALGDLQLNPALLQRFDYYLTATGERSLADITAQISRDLDQELKPSAAAEAKRILAKYLQFKEALASLALNPALAGQSLDTLHLRLLAIQNIRSRFFTRDEITALFAEEDQQDAQLEERLAISQNRQLGAQQQAQQLAALDSRLSAGQQKARSSLTTHLTLAAQVEAAKLQGAGTGQIYQLRSQSAGEAAAARLAALDVEEAAWQAKTERYLAEKSVLPSLPPAERDSARQQLRDRYFSAQEQKRLAAYE